MIAEDHLTDEAPHADSGPAHKRRKLRKGTQSCWECKRRKARCTFSAATQHVCEGCKRRGTDCVGQDVADRPPPPGSNKQIVDRLGQVEALVGQLLKAAREDQRSGEQSLIPERRAEGVETSRSKSPVASVDDAKETPAGHLPRDAATPEDTPVDTPAPGEHDALTRKLLAAWPNQPDLDIILGIPVETSQIIRAVTCTRMESSGSTLPSPRGLLQLPPPGAHPVLVARKLLVLATFLQGIPPSLARHLESLSTSCEALMSRAVKTAHDLVTSNDDLVASLEGIECIMLEGLYENYGGHLRRSWLAARRAIVIAQMLGLDRGVTPPSLTGGGSPEAEDMWFRLVQFDRYISLMLGLPQSSLEETFARPEALQRCTPLERMLRLICVAGGRLLQRRPSEMYDSSATEEVDKLLQDASAQMPAQWWLTPILSPHANHVERIRETLRFNNHFAHYHTLLQLHLPYILRSERQYDYNRMTAVTASREILSRFRSFRTFQTARCYCRGVDLIAFISSTALCLAHIRGRSGTEGEGVYLLAHQRLSDRGLLEETLTIMKELAEPDDDVIAGRVAALLQYLLVAEQEVASGAKYTVAFVPECRKDGDDMGYRVKLSEDGTVLDIHLPHFWVIRVKREDIGEEGLVQTTGGVTQPLGSWQDMTLASPFETSHGSRELQGRQGGNGPSLVPQDATADNYWGLENMDLSFLDNFYVGIPGLDTQAI